MSKQQTCPKCGEECDRDSVHIGIGIIYGPWGCPACGWSESSEYDCSEGPKFTPEGHRIDQFGGLTPNIK